MLKMITSPMKEEFPRTAGEGTATVIKTKEVEIYISPPPMYPPIRTEGMYSISPLLTMLQRWWCMFESLGGT